MSNWEDVPCKECVTLAICRAKIFSAIEELRKIKRNDGLEYSFEWSMYIAITKYADNYCTILLDQFGRRYAPPDAEEGRVTLQLRYSKSVYDCMNNCLEDKDE